MCSTGLQATAAATAAEQDPAPRTKPLNPGALAFRADSSASESSSPGRRSTDSQATPTSVMEQPAAPRGDKAAQAEYILPPETQGKMIRSSSGHLARQDSRGARRQAWDSPPAQAAMCASPPPALELLMPPTRQLSVLVRKEEDDSALLQQLTRHGALRHFDTSKRATQGVVVATFYDLRAAIAAHDALAAPCPPQPPGMAPAPPPAPRSVRFVPLESCSDEAAVGILAVEVTEGDLGRDELGRMASAIGEVCGLWGSGGLYFLEYLDSRGAEAALEQLEDAVPEGCQLAVRHADLDPIVLLGRTSSVAQVAASMRSGMMRGPPSRSSSFSRSASPPPILPPGSPPPMVVPVMPAYSWGAAYPVFHMYPPEVGQMSPMERAASPPAVFPNGGSPPLPTGFISIPVRTSSGSLYGGSPPYAAPPPALYGSSPPSMGSSPPAVMFMAPPPTMFDANGAPIVMAPGGDYHGRLMPAPGPDVMQRMAGMSLQQAQQQAQQDGKQQRSDSRASARIARSHRAGGAYDPSEFEFDVEEAESGRPEARTTVMIRNIPNKYTQAVMLEVLEKSGFKGTFDFFYLPIDFRNKCNLGYAFVNFTSAAPTARLYRQFHAKRWEEYNSRKVCEVTYARVQGRDPLIEHFRASKFPSEDMDYMPLVYTQVAGGAASHPVTIHQYLAAPAAREVAAADAAGAAQPKSAEGDAGERSTEQEE